MIDYAYPTSADCDEEADWEDLENTYDEDWRTYGQITPGPLGSSSVTNWYFDSIVASQITISISGKPGWFSRLRVQIDGVWHQIYYFYTWTWKGTFTFPEGTVTAAELKLGWGAGPSTVKVFEVALSFSADLNADFSAEPQYGVAPMEVAFTDLSNNDGIEPTSRVWDFGDGETSEEQNPIHTFQEVDTYTIRLTVTWPTWLGREYTDTKVKNSYVLAWRYATLWADLIFLDLDADEVYYGRCRVTDEGEPDWATFLIAAGTVCVGRSYYGACSLAINKDNLNAAWAGYLVGSKEDFTTYAEEDPNDDINITANKCDVDTMRNDAVAYVRKDKGAGYFGDFAHQITVYTGTADAYGGALVWAVSNGSRTFQEMLAVEEGLALDMNHWNVATVAFTLYDYETGHMDGSSIFSPETLYYCTIKRSGTTLTCKIYSNAARTILVDTLSVTCGANSYRYVFPAASEGEEPPSESEISFYTQDLRLELPGYIVWFSKCTDLNIAWTEPVAAINLNELGCFDPYGIRIRGDAAGRKFILAGLRGSTNKIYLARSITCGTSWTGTVVVEDELTFYDFAIDSQDNIYVVGPYGMPWGFHCWKSLDNGMTFGAPVRINDDAKGYCHCEIDESDNLHVIAVGDPTGNEYWYHWVSEDGGATFSAAHLVDNVEIKLFANSPAHFSIEGSDLYLFWWDNSDQLRYSHSDDGGVTWAASVVIYTPNDGEDDIASFYQGKPNAVCRGGRWAYVYTGEPFSDDHLHVGAIISDDAIVWTQEVIFTFEEGDQFETAVASYFDVTDGVPDCPDFVVARKGKMRFLLA